MRNSLLLYRSCLRDSDEEHKPTRNLKKVEKTLDKFESLWYLKKAPLRRTAVPCKLNNVRRTINTLDNYMDCLSDVYRITANEILE